MVMIILSLRMKILIRYRVSESNLCGFYLQFLSVAVNGTYNSRLRKSLCEFGSLG